MSKPARETPAGRPGSMLVTGASGIVGSELMAQARAQGWDVVGVGRRGDPANGVLTWRMGAEPPPAEIDRPWDVVIHSAADTRWNLPLAEARSANLAPTEALTTVVGRQTFVVHLSTFFAAGRTGTARSPAPEDYRNSYEWSKAAAERFVRDTFPRSVIVRPPMIIGRSTDGVITRFNGIYTVLGAATSGLLAVVVGDPDARVELVPVDATAALVLALARDRDDSVPVHVLGAGEECLTLREIMEIGFSALNAVRRAEGVEPVESPPFVGVDAWERFYLPFSQPHLNERQRLTIDILDAFRPYFAESITQNITDKVTDVGPAVDTAVRWWARRRSRIALRSPWRWSLGSTGNGPL
ncbi:SDR family oxidoreductase [Plantactinospora sp. B6F1]|uniref:SDR family oxidoreductase n=1 Tax=Plantactinospora sp. B6F1 TaxID=3158971 RepID=UPI00102C7369